MTLMLKISLPTPKNHFYETGWVELTTEVGIKSLVFNALHWAEIVGMVHALV